MQGHELRAPVPRRLTRAEYDRMARLGFFRGERVELLRGTIIAMSPIGPRHRSVVDKLTEILVPQLVGRARVSIQQPFLAEDESESEPDVAVLPLARYSERHPDHAYLIIEVAESSLAFDRNTKAPLYAASGVLEYWVVDAGARCIHMYAASAEGQYTRAARAEGRTELRVGQFPDVSFLVSSLFE